MAEINVGQISEALNNKADLDLNNTQPLADYVVEYQRPTADNNYTWYRLYKSGWVEQGGFLPANTSSITLPVAMSDANYMFQISGYKRSETSTMTWAYISSNTQTPTNFTIKIHF